MENKETNINVTEAKELTNEELATILQQMSLQSDLPRGTVDEIFNLGVKVERQRQNLIAGSRIMKDFRKEQKKKEKKQKEKLLVRVARKFGYELKEIPKEPKQTEEKK